MKTSHVLLLGSTIAAFAYRDEIKKLFDKQTGILTQSIKDYAGEKVSISPYKMPKIGFDIRKQRIKLEGSVLFENKTPVTAVLDSYSIDVILEKDGKLLLLGKTPLLQPRIPLISSGKTKVDYRFNMSLNDLNRILNNTANVEQYQMFILIKNLQVSGFSLPNQKIQIAGKWQKIIQDVKNPTDLLTDLFNN